MALRIERVWAMPNSNTFTILPIELLLLQEMGKGVWYDPFSGEYSPVPLECRNDLNPDKPAASHLDALMYLKGLPSDCATGILFDPPYSITQASQMYADFGRDKLDLSVSNMRYWASVKNEMARIIKLGGKAICCGWSSMGLGKGRGFAMTRVLLVPHGGSKNDTIVTVETKAAIQQSLPLGETEH